LPGCVALFGLLTALVKQSLALPAHAVRPCFYLRIHRSVFLALLDVDTAPVGRSAYFGLKAAECAGIAGVAVIILGVFTAIGSLTGKGVSAHMTAMVIFMVQALASIGMALGVGLTTLLRSNGVEIELPPKPEPKPKPEPVQAAYPPQAYPPGYPPSSIHRISAPAVSTGISAQQYPPAYPPQQQARLQSRHPHHTGASPEEDKGRSNAVHVARYPGECTPERSKPR